jgi:hypothetical protein
VITETRSIHAEGETLDLNPFAFWPAYSSRLKTLGGTEPCDDPDYVFHTLYAACGDGPIVMTVKASDLTAERGTLILRIHELPDGLGSSARQVAIAQVQMLDLIRGGGVATIGAHARHGHTYAALGHIYGDTVASASDLQVQVERRTPDPDAPDQPSDFTSTRIAATPAMVGTAPPSITGPTSQMCSAPQFRERVYADWAVHLGGSRKEMSLAQWERVYIARALDRYDMSRSGARGLAIGAANEPQLVNALAATGCRMTVSIRPTHAGAVPVDNVLVLDPEEMPDTVRGFDFVFATSEQGVAGHWKQRLSYIESILRCLKPGGLAIVLTDATAADETADAGLLVWPDIVRIGLTLLSRGHQVAQLRRDVRHPYFETDEAGIERSVFGFIVRRR